MKTPSAGKAQGEVLPGTLTQHFGVKLDTFTKAGALLANQDVDLTFL
jgi:hypothetical protein